MYSYEDRIRAVKLYIKLGKRVRATVRQLSYPWNSTCRRAMHSVCAGYGSTAWSPRVADWKPYEELPNLRALPGVLGA